MPDMLVRLYALPPVDNAMAKMAQEGVAIRRPQPHERTVVRAFVEKHFSVGWADEAMVAFAHEPITAYIAAVDKRIVGFGAYECTRRGFFGPTGVATDWRGKGIGLALLLQCLHGMWDMGYAYGIIGGAGPVDFYTKAVGAKLIPDSVPGIYCPVVTET